jgi:hypothetical protein
MALALCTIGYFFSLISCKETCLNKWWDRLLMFFSPNTNVLIREEICVHLNILVEALSDKYLGLPTLVGIDRSDCFQHQVGRVCQRISGWNEKLLSMGGKEILLKAIAQAILHMLCRCLIYRNRFARIFVTLSQGSGGVGAKLSARCTGWRGGR